MADANTEVPKVENTPSAITTAEAGQTEESGSTTDTKLDASAADPAAPTDGAAASSPVTSPTPDTEKPTTPGTEKPTTAADVVKEAAVAPAAPTDGAAASNPVTSPTPGTEQPTSPGTEKPTTPADVDKEAAVAPAGVVKEAAPKKTPFDEFDAKLPAILKEVGHDEMWGVKLVSPASSHVPTAIVIQKFLNANDGLLAPAIEQFTGALKFRKEKKPLDLVAKTFNAHKFADLGAVTVYAVEGSSVPEVFTWNLYGNVKGKMDEVFVPLNESVPCPPRHAYMVIMVAGR